MGDWGMECTRKIILPAPICAHDHAHQPKHLEGNKWVKFKNNASQTNICQHPQTCGSIRP